MNNKEFYESMFNYDGEFYLNNELECDSFIMNLDICLKDSQSNNKLFIFLKNNNIHYDQFIEIANTMKHILIINFINTKIIFNILDKIGIEFERDLKLLLDKIVKDTISDKDMMYNCELSNFKNYKELVSTENGEDFIRETFTENYFLNYM